MVSGQAALRFPDERSLVISASEKVILNFEQFAIAANETVQFMQPNAQSCALTRITGNDPSTILGRLTANGQLFLVNPNGIYFGPDAVVNAHSFMASTLNILDSDFLDNRYAFFVDPGYEKSSIINHGQLEALSSGFVTFCAPTIQNHGVVRAQAGKVTFASAERVSLDFSGDGLVTFLLDGEIERALIENYGEIESLRGQVELSTRTARNLVKSVVNTTGLEVANSIENCNGVIRLVSSGSVEAGSIAINSSFDGTTVYTNGSITTRGGDISISGPIVLESDTVLSTGSGSGDIILDGSINGSKNITLNAGRGNVIVKGPLGNVTRLGDVVVEDAHDVQVSSLAARSLFQRAATGTSTFTGGIDSNGASGICLNGTGFIHDGKFIATNGGSLVVANCGTLAMSSSNEVFVEGGYIQNGMGSVQLAGAISTGAGGISFDGATSLVGATYLDTSAGSGNIAFKGALNGSGSLILKAGMGDIYFGLNSQIGSLTIDSANTLTFQSLCADSVVGSSIYGLVTANGSMKTTGPLGLFLDGTSFAFNGDVLTEGLGSFKITNSGPLHFAPEATISVDGEFFQNGMGEVFVGNAIRTNNRDIVFHSPVILTRDTNLNSGTDGGDIHLKNVVDGGFGLIFGAGRGVVCFSSMGQTIPLTSLAVSNAYDVEVNGAVTVDGSFNLFSTGTATFTDEVCARGLNLTGRDIHFNAPVMTKNGGAVVIENSGLLTITSSLSSDGFFAQTGVGTVSLASNVSAKGDLSFGSAITLAGSCSLTSSGATIRLSNSINGANDLTLIPGGGNIFLGSVGQHDPIGALRLEKANQVTTETVSAFSIQQMDGVGTTHFYGPLLTTGANGISLAGTSFIFNSPVITTYGGPLTITHTKLLRFNPGADLNLSGSFYEYGAGVARIGANLTTKDKEINWSSPIELLNTVTFDSGSADISLNSVDGPHRFFLSAGGGRVFVQKAIGSNVPVHGLVVLASELYQKASVTSTEPISYSCKTHLGGDLKTDGKNIHLAGDVVLTNTALNIFTGDGAGSITIGGAINGEFCNCDLLLAAGKGDITLRDSIGANIPLTTLSISGGNVSCANLGSSVAGVSGTTTINALSDIYFTGTNYNAEIQTYTAKTNVDFTAGAPVLVKSSGSPIVFDADLLLLNPRTDVVIDAHGGDVTLSAVSGRAQSVTVDAGVLNYVKFGSANAMLETVNLTATYFSHPPPQDIYADTLIISSHAPITLHTDVNQLGSITYDAPVLIGGDVVRIINQSSGVANLSFNRTLDADVDGLTRNLILQSHESNITFHGAIGGVAPLTSISIESAGNVEVNHSIKVGSFIQKRGVGTTSFGSGIGTTFSKGIAINTANITFQGAISTANGGTLVLNNSGPFTASSVAFTLDGEFQQIGDGATIIIGGSVLSSNHPISFAAPLDLNSDFTINTNHTTGADITFNRRVDGAYTLALDAGAGNVVFNETVGGITPLGAISIASAHNVSIGELHALSLTQSQGTGETLLNGPVTCSGGIRLTGTKQMVNGVLSTSEFGSIVLENADTLTITSNGRIFSADAFVQTGVGQVNLAGQISANRKISFAAPTTLFGDTTLSASSEHFQNMVFGNTLDGDHSLTVTAGKGHFIFEAAVGATNRLGDLSIVSAENVTAQSITASSVTQVEGSGSTTIGELNTNGSLGIHLTGNNLFLKDPIVTTHDGAVTLANSGVLLLHGGVSSSDSFTQTGAGPVLLAGTISTNNQNISFSGPITIRESTVLDSGSGSGEIVLRNTVDGNAKLTLLAGSGNITFHESVGATAPLAELVINDGNDIGYSSINASSIKQLDSTGTTTINGDWLTRSSEGIRLNGCAITQNGTLTALGSGSIEFAHSSDFTINGNSICGGKYVQSGSGVVRLEGVISTNNATISFDAPIYLIGNSSLNTGPVGANITLLDTISGAKNLDLKAGIGSIMLADVGSSNRLGALTIMSAHNVVTGRIRVGSMTQITGTGSTVIGGTLNTNSGKGIHLTGTNFVLNDVVTTNQGSLHIVNAGTLDLSSGSHLDIGGPFMQRTRSETLLSGFITAGGQISFNGPVSLCGVTRLDSTANGEAILFSGPVNGSHDLILASGSNDIIFQQDVGAFNPLGNLSIVSAHHVATKGVFADSFTQSTGTGTTHLDGTISLTGPSGMNLTGASFILSGNPIDILLGPIAICNSDLLTLSKIISCNDAFSQVGSGFVALGGTIVTNNADISFSAPVSLISTAVLYSGVQEGNIAFSNSVEGSQSLTLNAGCGNIELAADIGGQHALRAFTIENAHNVITQDITAGCITQMAGSGTSRFGVLKAIHPAGTSTNLFGSPRAMQSYGIHLIGTHFTLTAPLTTLYGDVQVQQSGTIDAIDDARLDTSNGTIVVGGNWETHGNNLSFQGPLKLREDLHVATTGGDISFSNNVTGPFILAITADEGTVRFAPAQEATDIRSLMVHSAQDIHLHNVGRIEKKKQVEQEQINLNATNAIYLIGHDYHAQTQRFSAPLVHINGGSTVNLTSHGDIQLNNGLTQLSKGSHLSVRTSTGNFSYNQIEGSHSENIKIDSDSGNVYLNTIGESGGIKNLHAKGGNVYLAGSIRAENADLEAKQEIQNHADQVRIKCANRIAFNAQDGDVGTRTNPILVRTPKKVITGSTHLVNIDHPKITEFAPRFSDAGTHTHIQQHISNIPCVIIFNGTVLHDCNVDGALKPPYTIQQADNSWCSLSCNTYFLPQFVTVGTYLDRSDYILYEGRVLPIWTPTIYRPQPVMGHAHSFTQLDSVIAIPSTPPQFLSHQTQGKSDILDQHNIALKSIDSHNMYPQAAVSVPSEAEAH